MSEEIKVKVIKEHGYVTDIVVSFPEELGGGKEISFMDVGLINAKPDVRQLEGEKFPTVAVEFYGKLVYEER